MSYLDVPRLHFSGRFFSDPSTVNNDPASYAGTPTDYGWNPNGAHVFELRGCTVRRAIDKAGTVKSTAAGDALVGAQVTLVSGRAVDLDPQWQQATEIYGARLELALTGGGKLSAVLARTSLRELWPGRNPGAQEGFGGVFYTSASPLVWTGTSTSGVLAELRTAAAAGGGLSIKWVVYKYDTATREGLVVGSVGARRSGDEAHFLGARRLDEGAGFFELGLPGSAATPAFSAVPFKLDKDRRRLIVDLGNMLPDADRASLPHGRLHMAYRDSAGALVYLGKRIPYDSAHYVESAGVEEIALTRSETAEAAKRPLLLKVDQPKVKVVLHESRSFLDVDRLVHRIDPGASVTTTVAARTLGAVKAGQKIAFARLSGTPASALTFPASVTTDATGHAPITLTAGDPGTPRGALDGQLYAIGCFWDDASLPSNLRAVLHVLVFSKYVAPAKPTWADVRPIFTQYARLYPVMAKKFVDLSDEQAVRNLAAALAQSMRRDVDDGHFMPISRDLSAAKTRMILTWLDAVTVDKKTP